MAYVLVHHTVEEYNKWKPFYDGMKVTESTAVPGERIFSEV